MKKLITVILAAILAMTVFAGCGGSGGNSDFDPSGLQKQLDELQDKITDQAGKIADQASKIADQASKIADQAGKIADQADELADQADKLADQAGKIAGLENQVEAQQEEIDRLYGQYDWDNPIVITDLAAFENKYKNNRAEFDKIYLGRVIQTTDIVFSVFTAVFERRNSPGIRFANTSIMWVFFSGRPNETQRVTIMGVYNSLEDNILIIDACRVVEILS